MHARRTGIFFQSMDVIYSNSACMTKSSFNTGKLCKALVHLGAIV